MTTELLQHLLPGPLDPDTAFHALFAHHPNALWFDDHGERGAGISYLAAGTPVPLEHEHWRAQLRAAHHELVSAWSGEKNLGRIPLGVVVVLPYELAASTVSLVLPGDQDAATPRALVVDQVVAVEHDTGRAWVYGLGEPGDPAWEHSIAGLEAALREARPPAEPLVEQNHAMSWRDDPQRYREMIHSAQLAITRGDAYQLCVTTQVLLTGECDPIALHRVMRRINPTHHQALIRLGDVSIVSASPETFIDLTPERRVTTRPIKGTRPRGETPEQDLLLASQLLESDKERAENLMIVDLMRNDLSRVCEVGSVQVPELLVVETYASVHQLVSTVTGELSHGVDFLDVIQATFPAGSMTGAPKRRAVELLASWESGPRGYYSGAYGVWRVDGSATLAMTIRSAVVTKEGLTLGVGGGITALSDPDSEVAEVRVKAVPFLRALGQEQVQYS
jgi:para-aminobenzoate synthetase component 1